MEFHDLCLLFPEDRKAIDDIKDDMKEHGFSKDHRIVVYDGKILDGRHRYVAAEELGIKPRFTKYNGDDPIGLVMRENAKRRQLTPGQRAIIGAELANLTRGSHTEDSEFSKDIPNSPAGEFGIAEESTIKPVTIKEAAEIVGTSPRSIDRAKAIKVSEKLYSEVVEGKKSLKRASEELRAKKEVIPDDTMAHIEAGAIDFDEAYEEALYEHQRRMEEELEYEKRMREEAQEEDERIRREALKEKREREQEEKDRIYEEKQKKMMDVEKWTLKEAFAEFGIGINVITKDSLEALFKHYAKKAHPDLGGSDEAIMRVTNARLRILNDFDDKVVFDSREEMLQYQERGW